MVSAATGAIREIVASLPDPELPVVTIDQLGILRDVAVDESGRVEVAITPTYSGCPAMETIRADILTALAERGYGDARVTTVLAPAWTTDWISASGLDALSEAGIAPPAQKGRTIPLALTLRCPRCGSPDTRELSRFGSTACKAIWVCNECLEPFDHVKRH